MKQSVTLRIPVPDGWDGRDRLQVFTDWGTGTIDTTKPLLPEPIEVFRLQREAMGVGQQVVGGARADLKAGRRPGTLGQGTVGVTPVGQDPETVDVSVELPAAFGPWKFAAQSIDRYGNVQSEALAAITKVVSATEPAGLSGLTFSSYDGGTDRVTFAFERNAA